MAKDKIKQWAEALSGKSKDIDPLIHKKAQALRKILKEEDEALTKKYSTFNQASFERTKNALESSGLLQKEIDLTKSFFTKQVAYIKLIFVFILGLCTSLLMPLLTINAPMQVASNDQNLKSSSGYEQASKENKKDLSNFDELKNINPRINLLTSHTEISVNDYLELSKIHSRESEEYLNKYISLAFNNFIDYGNLLKAQHKKPLICFKEEKTYKVNKLRELIDSEVNDKNKINLNQRVEIVLLNKLIRENPCN